MEFSYLYVTYHPAEALSTFIFNRHSLFSIIIFCLFLPIFSRKDSFFVQFQSTKFAVSLTLFPVKFIIVL